MPTEEEARAALKEVVDPELNINIVDLGLVYGIKVEGKKVTATVTFTSPACPVGPMIVGNAKMALERLEGVDEALVEVTFDPPWSPEKASEEIRAQFEYL